MSSFNASMEVTEVLAKTLENASKSLAMRCIKECSERHNFDFEEECRILGLDNVTLIRKKIEKKATSEKSKSFSLPFLLNTVNKNGCNGLAFNEGLFTQCQKVRTDNEIYCKKCLDECKTSANNEPKNGTVTKREQNPLYSYADNQGRKPSSYNTYMKKHKITEDEVKAYAAKLNIEIPSEIFTYVARSAKGKKAASSVSAKGRPKKKNLVVLEDDKKEDLFASLSSDEKSCSSDDTSLNEEQYEGLSDEKKAEKEAEKAQKKAERELAKAAEKAKKDAEKAKEKEEREAKLAQEKAEKAEKLAQEKAEKEAKKNQEKAEREAKLAQEKAEKAEKLAQEKAEKEAKRLQEKAEKEAKLAQEKAEKAEKIAKEKAEKEAKKSPPKPKAEEKKEEKEEENEKTVEVRRVIINGVKYLKTNENKLYDEKTQEPVGIWCEITQTILDLVDDDEEDA
jgi:chemotaxis protein histidine kinase CheA